MIRLDIALARDGFQLEARFAAGAGVTALVGPSGAGKTTILDLIAGLLRPDRGRIELDGTVLVDIEAGGFVPPHRRAIGYVFQEARLFPHLSVRGNLDYARNIRRFGGARPGGASAKFDDIVSLLGLEKLLSRRPNSLSGGERQRVAIGRALLSDPRLLLMDEPLASIDVARKDELLPYLEMLRDARRVPILYVTHIPAEVDRLADAVVKVEAGKVQAVPVAA